MEVPQSKVALLSWDQDGVGSPVQTGWGVGDGRGQKLERVGAPGAEHKALGEGAAAESVSPAPRGLSRDTVESHRDAPLWTSGG